MNSCQSPLLSGKIQLSRIFFSVFAASSIFMSLYSILYSFPGCLSKMTILSMYINSPGGSVTAGLAIYDTMQFISCPVATYCVGQAASMGAVLLTAGAKGKRFALPNSRIMIHQPWGGAEGKASDIEITAREILRLKEMLNGILSRHSGKSMDDVARDTDRDHFMSAEEACRWGLIDKVLAPKAE